MEEKLDNDYGHWSGPTFDIDDHFGFIYQITHIDTDRKYIGQKRLWAKVTRPPLKGRKNKRRSVKESKWKEYTGSSNTLNEDIESLGHSEFKFEILRLCNSRFELTYYENKMIYETDALLKNEYYNGFVGRCGRPPDSLMI